MLGHICLVDHISSAAKSKKRAHVVGQTLVVRREHEVLALWVLVALLVAFCKRVVDVVSS